MIITKTAETITLNSGQVITERIFMDITNISFDLKDDKVIAYIKMGYEVTQTIPMTDGETEIVECVISHKGKSFTEARMKEMLDLNSIIFNSDQSNLLLTEMISNSITILMSVITEDPSQYFGITAENWEIA